jgi:hypothetical protein
MSVHSWKQPDSHGHNGTSSGQKHPPASPGNPRPWAVSAGGGRSRIRTWEGEADGFTASPLPAFPMGTDLRILHSCGREIGPLSVWRPCRASCPGQSHASLPIRSHGVQGVPPRPIRTPPADGVRCSPSAPPCRVSRPARDTPAKMVAASDLQCTSDVPGIYLAFDLAPPPALASAANTPNYPILFVMLPGCHAAGVSPGLRTRAEPCIHPGYGEFLWVEVLTGV